MRNTLWIIALLVSSGIIGCFVDDNPCKGFKPYCDGNVGVYCFNSRDSDSGPYQRSILNNDCTQYGLDTGVDKICKVTSNDAQCVDASLTKCLPQDLNGARCDSNGWISFCIETLDGLFVYSSRCYKKINGEFVFDGECHLLDTAGINVTCVDSPKVACDPKANLPCDNEKMIECIGSESTGYYQYTNYCMDSCPCP